MMTKILHEIRIFLTWPVVTLIIVIIFKNAISSFLKRLVKGEGPGGWKFEASSPSQQSQKIKEAPQPQTDSEIEAFVSKNPKAMLEEYKRTFNGYWFERSYNLIYGTQISLLENLERKGSEGDKYINLTPFYNDFLRRSRFTNTQMADYLKFLKDAHFIEYTGEGVDIVVKITPYGVDFLSYIKVQYPYSYKYKIF